MADRDIYTGFTGKFARDFELLLEWELPPDDISDSVLDSILTRLRFWKNQPLQVLNDMAKLFAELRHPNLQQLHQIINSANLKPTAMQALQAVAFQVWDNNNRNNLDQDKALPTLINVLLQKTHLKNFEDPCREQASKYGLSNAETEKRLANVRQLLLPKLEHVARQAETKNSLMKLKQPRRAERKKIELGTKIPVKD